VAHFCQNPDQVGLNREKNIVRLMERVLVTTRELAPEEAHILGFSRAAFNEYLGRASTDDTLVMLARGGILGGSRQYLEVASAVFNVIATDTIKKGLLGTDENILR
jgi:hypothetical protein